MRKAGADRAKSGSYGLYGDVEQPNSERRSTQRHERTRSATADARPQNHYQEGDDGHGERLRINRVEVRRNGSPFGDELDRQISHLEAEEIPHLARKNDHRNSAGKSDYDWLRNELDRASELGDAEYHEDHPGHDRGHDEAIDSVFLDDPIDDDDECPGRPSDLYPRATERADQESSDDGGIKSAVRRDAARDRESDCEWKCHHADDHARGEIGSELGAAVRLERRDRFRDEQDQLTSGATRPGRPEAATNLTFAGAATPQ